MGRWIDSDYLKLYRMDRLAIDRNKFEFTARVVSSCKDILMPQMKITIHYHQKLYGNDYVMDFSCRMLDSDYGVMYAAVETLKDMFREIVAQLICNLKHVKLIHVYPDGYKEVSLH